MADTEDANPQKGVPKGEKVPREGLEIAEGLAKKLWDTARNGSVKRAAYAAQLNHTNVTSGGFQAKVGLLRYYNLVQTSGDDMSLSDIGKRIVREDNETIRVAARREALLGQKHFGPVLRSYADNELPTVAALTSNFKFEFGLADDTAARVAEAFISSAKFAGFIDNSNVVRLAPTEIATPATVEEHVKPPSGAATGVTPPPPFVPPTPPPAPPIVDTSVALRNVTLDVQLDLSSFAVDDVLRVLTALGLVQADDEGQ